MKVNLMQIRIDGGTQSRVMINQEWVHSFVEKMKEGDIFPPLNVVHDGSHYWLWDGFHRYLAYMQLGVKDADVNSRPGTLSDARVLSFGANGKHGLPRTNADKRKAVEDALGFEVTKDKTDSEIARICDVSPPFVASVRSPEAKQRQDEAKKKHTIKKAREIIESNPVEPIESDRELPGSIPDEMELKANERAMEMDIEAMQKLLASDDALKTAHDEIKRLNGLMAQFEIRFHGLMNERNELIKEVKRLQKFIDSTKGK